MVGWFGRIVLGTGGCLFEKDKGDGEIRRPPPTPRVWGEMFLSGRFADKGHTAASNIHG